MKNGYFRGGAGWVYFFKAAETQTLTTLFQRLLSLHCRFRNTQLNRQKK